MLRWFINIFIAIVISVLAIGALHLLLIGPMPLEVPILIMLFGGALGTIAWTSGLTRLNGYHNRRQSGLILAYLEQAVRLNLPLSRMLLAAQTSERGSLARKIEHLRHLLDKGASITAGVKAAVPGTPARTLGLLGASERVGRVGAELNRLVRDQQKPGDRGIAERSFVGSYPFGMIVVIVFVVGMLMVYVMPRYQLILKDFKIPLPPITVALIDFIRFLGNNGWLHLVFLLSVAVAIIQRVRLSTGNRKPVSWFITSRQYADVCHVIADAMAAGEPLDSAILAASQLAIAASLQRKLRRWADGIEQGLPPAEAAADAGMPRLIAGLTGTSQVAATAEAFGFLSRYYAAKFSRWITLVRAAVIPAMVFFFGSIVAAIALAMFMPLVAMIDGLSSYGGWL